MSENGVMGRFVGVRLKCAGCGGWFHELTAAYETDRLLTGACLRLCEPYRSYGWYDFPHNESTTGDNILCPQCMYPYRHEDVRLQAEAWLEKLRGDSGGPAPTAALPEMVEQTLEVVDDADTVAAETEPAAGEDEGFDEGPPEKIGDLEAPVSACSCDDRGVVADAARSSGLVERVRQLMWQGRTQAEIAEICQISVYRVRQIQNGEGV